jgi:hypothetical protein
MLIRYYDANDQPLRYASAIAAACSLHTSIEKARCLAVTGRPEKLCHVWRGTAEQFCRLWLLAPSDRNFASIKKMRWLCPGWLRGHLYRDGPDAYRYVIEFGIELSRQQENKIFGRAHADTGFQRFRTAMLTKVELHDEES